MTPAAGWTVALAIPLAVAGFAIAIYLTVTHFGDQPIVCTGIGDCELVNSSEYASIAGVPVALLGAIAYAVIVLLAVAELRTSAGVMLVAGWAVALASFAFSAYLTYIELYVIDAICVYCVASASLMTAIFALLSVALWARACAFDDRVQAMIEA
jgi:uncharacterized membrane protein